MDAERGPLRLDRIDDVGALGFIAFSADPVGACPDQGLGDLSGGQSGWPELRSLSARRPDQG
jgi:hypothetical protein